MSAFGRPNWVWVCILSWGYTLLFAGLWEYVPLVVFACFVGLAQWQHEKWSEKNGRSVFKIK